MSFSTPPPSTKRDSVASPTYYGVYIGSPDPEVQSQRHVYSDKDETLKVVKKCKSSRFKLFYSFEEAERFSLNGPRPACSPSTSVGAERCSPYKAPVSQDLVAFRKCIERGELDKVKATVERNPRYLVSSGDTPAVLQEGARYNALHVAAKFDRARICEYVLERVACPQFVRKLYGEEEIKDTVKQRCKILVDFYLNTPDKAANETPLHFASKMGSLDVVKVLVSYDQCDKTRRNKQGQSAADVVGSRRAISAEVKEEIERLLRSDYYVGVLRPLDPVRPPVLDGPFLMPSRLGQHRTSPSFEGMHISERPSPVRIAPTLSSPTSKDLPLRPELPWLSPLSDEMSFSKEDSPLVSTRFAPTQMSPCCEEMRISGVAGPMTYAEALHFKKLWRRLRGSPLSSPCSPPPSSFKKPDKVVERLGRELSAELGVYWVEYWPFLSDFANFRHIKGLDLLEKYFASRADGDKVDIVLEDNLDDVCHQLSQLWIKENDRHPTTSSPTFKVDLSYSHIDKTCQVYANKLSESLVSLDDRSFFKTVIRCHELIVSCATDRRYSRVEFNRIHSRLAVLVKKSLYFDDSLTVDRLVEFITDFVSIEKVSSTPTVLCLCRKILGALNGNLEETYKDGERGDGRCINEETVRFRWLLLDPCQCVYEEEFKPSKKRLNFWTRMSCDNSDMSIEDNDSDNFATPPTSPRLNYRTACRNNLSFSIDEDVSSDDESFFSVDEGWPLSIEPGGLKEIDRTVYEAVDKDKVLPSKHPYVYQWLQECSRKFDLPDNATPPHTPLFLSPLSPSYLKRCDSIKLSLREHLLNNSPLSSK